MKILRLVVVAALGASAVLPVVAHPGHDHDDHDHDHQSAPKTSVKPTPFYLSECPVTGEPLGEDAVIHTVNGREFRFANAAALETFNSDPGPIIEAVDRKMIADQLPYYPLDVCVVSGEKLGSMGEAENLIHNNRLVRFCCAGCIGDFKDDPDAYLSKIDNAVIAAQGPNYPATACLISTKPVASDPESVQEVIASRLVRYCCPGCPAGLRKQPAKHIAAIDEAWKASGKSPAPTAN